MAHADNRRTEPEPDGRRVLAWPCAALLALVAAGVSASERQHGPHVHGVGQLNVASEGERVEIELISPGADIVGFEHQAETQTDREAVEKAVARLKAGAQLFGFPAEADCRLEEAEVESALMGEERHEGEAREEHAEFHVRYRFLCARPDALTHVDVGFFQAFPAAQELEAQFITARGQGARELTPASARLKF